MLTIALCNAQQDSVCVNNIDELSYLEDYQVEKLAINFKPKRNFDYSLIPKGLKSLRFLKPSKNLVEAGVLMETLNEIRTIELNGRMTEFLPELVALSKKLDTVILSNTKLSQIWNYTAFLDSHHIDVLVLCDFKIDEKCSMYKGIFIGGSMQVDKIIYKTNKKVSPNQQALIMNIFNTRNLWINGERQQVYFN